MKEATEFERRLWFSGTPPSPAKFSPPATGDGGFKRPSTWCLCLSHIICCPATPDADFRLFFCSFIFDFWFGFEVYLRFQLFDFEDWSLICGSIFMFSFDFRVDFEVSYSVSYIFYLLNCWTVIFNLRGSVCMSWGIFEFDFLVSLLFIDYNRQMNIWSWVCVFWLLKIRAKIISVCGFLVRVGRLLKTFLDGSFACVVAACV